MGGSTQPLLFTWDDLHLQHYVTGCEADHGSGAVHTCVHTTPTELRERAGHDDADASAVHTCVHVAAARDTAHDAAHDAARDTALGLACAQLPIDESSLSAAGAGCSPCLRADCAERSSVPSAREATAGDAAKSETGAAGTAEPGQAEGLAAAKPATKEQQGAAPGTSKAAPGVWRVRWLNEDGNEEGSESGSDSSDAESELEFRVVEDGSHIQVGAGMALGVPSDVVDMHGMGWGELMTHMQEQTTQCK